MLARSEKSSKGFSLVELVIVVLILGVVAVVAIPFLSTANEKKLALAADEIASAMQYARTQSVRLGQPFGFSIQAVDQRIRVFRADFSGTSPAFEYNVYHPFSKQLYDIDLRNHAFASAETLVLESHFVGSCSLLSDVFFNEQGMPHCVAPATRILLNYQVLLNLGSYSRLVTLHGVTGRVTIE